VSMLILTRVAAFAKNRRDFTITTSSSLVVGVWQSMAEQMRCAR
jgi:hypothetical protein